MMRLTSLKAGVAAAVLVATLSGCVVTARPAAIVVPGEVVTYSAPPPPRAEVIGVAPMPGYFWVAGHYRWEGGAYVWHGGVWTAPRPGYHYVAHEWHPVGNTWHYSPGHWVRG
jgi:hypothetical protein